MQLDAVEHGTHGMLANAEVQHPAIWATAEHPALPVCRQEAGLTLRRGVVGFGEVSRATPQFRQLRRNCTDDLSGGCPGGNAFRIGIPAGQHILPARAEVVIDEPFVQGLALRVCLRPAVVGLLPLLLSLRSTLDQLASV